ncbi:carbohydrate-binding protein [Amycolatopsis sp. PS_44_ISF1]|uniref:carbohydrate-binding protein n=1 Tax=Amycolatopsis sp. PS_44_ISF1 TaxID=2974917 RepID=UPI0028DE2ADB|nr:carbohydrate-binding protein [Amycolatopsis sp. PS_44_ISF1]MDT8914752.1 carbohydrate-binding protein [Amycolatopsis sp. PS_44_ISF1]
MRKLPALLTSLLIAAAVTAAAGSSPASAAPAGGVVPGLTGAAAKAAAGPAADRFLQMRRTQAHRAGTARPDAQQHTFWGPEPQLSTGADGLVVTHSVVPDLRISNSSDVVYAPTVKPTGHSCIEVVTAYGLGQAGQVWAWDWCRSVSPAKVVPIDSSFLSRYTSTVDGHPAYTVQEVKTNSGSNGWTASLYNVKTGAWDTLFTQSGSDQSGLDEGWDIFELYSTVDPSTDEAYYCADARGKVFESSSLKLRVRGSWVAATPSNSPLRPTAHPNPGSYDCSSLRFEVPAPNSNWRVSV